MGTSLFFHGIACHVTVVGGGVVGDCRKMLYYTVNTLSFFKDMEKARKSKPFSSGICHLIKVAPPFPPKTPLKCCNLERRFFPT